VAGAVGGVALVLVMAVAAGTAVVTGGPRARPISLAALAVLAAAVAGSVACGPGWLAVWVLLAITCPAVLRGRRLVGALVLVIVGAVLAAWAAGTSTTAIEVQGFVVSLSGAATASFLRLTETVEELRRTREQLARAAVVEERERFSRDLHDLLGHTLSVIVVKAQAVRRLVAADPDAAAAHAADIEQVGRSALLDVRHAVDAMRQPSLAEELDGARRALSAAGIEATVTAPVVEVPVEADQALAWVVREGATNVLRHSGAARCRIELSNGSDRLRLTMSDDGVGGPVRGLGLREGGLDGLRRRLVAAGGELELDPSSGEGFRLVATVPVEPR
jgi:two-component system sensor histidine kinase DesK